MKYRLLIRRFADGDYAAKWGKWDEGVRGRGVVATVGTHHLKSGLVPAWDEEHGLYLPGSRFEGDGKWFVIPSNSINIARALVREANGQGLPRSEGGWEVVE